MSLRGRAILVAVVVGLMALLAFPNLFTEQERLDSVWIPDDALSLGLDLQGGIHWLLRIDDAEALRQEVDRTRSVIETMAADEGVRLSAIRLSEDHEHIELEGDLEALRTLVEENFDTVDVERDGATLVVTLSEEWRDQVIERGVQQAQEVLNERIDGLGVREPVIAPQGAGRILVQMPGAIDPAQARSILEETTFLEFKKVLASAPNEELLRARYDNGLPPDTQIVVDEGEEGAVAEAFLVPSSPILTGAMLEDARIGYDRRNRPLVTFTWNSEGTQIFRDFTGENIGERLAAIIDGKVATAPVIQSRIGRNGQITGNFTAPEAAALAVALRSGALPIPLVIEEERTVGPALGADSIRQGINSILLGGALVILFMGVYYSGAGWLANLALVVDMVAIVGLMSLAGATLTLPGIAGLVLTVGMAVDANVIIFERVREELRGARNLRTAVATGFRRSALTILDANVTTLIAAVVLLQFGRGPVQGFGVTLAIGIVASVFGALVVTRLLVDLVVARRPELLRF